MVCMNSFVSADNDVTIRYRWSWLAFNCGSTFGISGGKWQLAAKYVPLKNGIQLNFKFRR